MSSAYAISTFGRLLNPALPFAGELAIYVTIADETDRRLSLSNLLFQLHARKDRDVLDGFFQTLVTNHPELLDDVPDTDENAFRLALARIVNSRIEEIIKQNSVDVSALVCFANFMLSQGFFQPGILFLKKVLQVTPDPAMRDEVANRLLSFSPHRFSPNGTVSFLPSAGRSRLIICDKSVNPAFLQNVIKSTETSTVHFYRDIDNKHALDFSLPSGSTRLGCRDIISRYDDSYVSLMQGAHIVGQKVAKLAIDDPHLRNTFSESGLNSAVTLLVSDYLFWMSYYKQCLGEIVRRHPADDIVFVLGTNAELWSIAAEYIGGSEAEIVWCCAPSENVTLQPTFGVRLKNLSALPAQNVQFETTVMPGDAASDQREITRRVRYFLSCIDKRGQRFARSVVAEQKEAAKSIVVAGGYYPTFLHSLKAVVEGLSQFERHKIILCDYGPDPVLIAASVGVTFESGDLFSGMISSASYIDLFTSPKKDVFPSRLGRWLLAYHRNRIDILVAATNKDMSLPLTVRNAFAFYADELFNQHIPVLLANLAVYREFLSCVRPSLVLLCPSRPKEAMLFAVAGHALAIKIVSFDPHILDSSYPRNLAIYADSAFVISRYYADIYSKYFRIENDNIHVVGSLRQGAMLDALSGISQRQARQSLGWDGDDRPTVLVVLQPIAWETIENCVDRIAKGIKLFGRDVRVVLRLHREEAEERRIQYLRIFLQHGLGELINPGLGDIAALILASDCILGFYSTALAEAAAADRPVMVVQPIEKKWSVDWSTLGLAASGTTPEQIADFIDSSIGKVPSDAPFYPQATAESVMSKIMLAIDLVIERDIRRADFLSPADIFVQYHKQDNIVG